MGSDLRLLYKYGNTETGLLSKRRSDPTDIVGQSRIATSVSSADFTVSLCWGGFRSPEVRKNDRMLSKRISNVMKLLDFS